MVCPMDGARTDLILSQQRGLKPWQPGQSGNPAGRPKGSRNKLTESFLDALLADFIKRTEQGTQGAQAIADMRGDKPGDYAKMIAGLLAKELDGSPELLDAISMIGRRVIDPANG